MASKLPRGFSLPKRKDDKGGLSDPKARPPSKKDGKKPVEPQDLRKRGPEALADSTTAKKLKIGGTPTTTPTPTRRSKGEGASVPVSNLFGPVAVPYVSENLVHKWQGLPPEDQDLAMIQASAQLLTQSIGHAQRNQELKLQVNKLKSENKKLEEMVVESNNKWKKDLDAAMAEVRQFKGELDDADERDKILCTSIEKLKSEKEDMQVKIDDMEIEKSDWLKERDSLEKSSFMNGFHCYLLNFLAQDPDYDWTQFGPGCVEDIAAFKVERAGDIKSRRVELGLEKDDEGTPFPGEVPPVDEATDQTPTSPPANFEKNASDVPTIPPQDASTEGAP